MNISTLKVRPDGHLKKKAFKLLLGYTFKRVSGDSFSKFRKLTPGLSKSRGSVSHGEEIL